MAYNYFKLNYFSESSGAFIGYENAVSIIWKFNPHEGKFLNILPGLLSKIYSFYFGIINASKKEN